MLNVDAIICTYANLKLNSTQDLKDVEISLCKFFIKQTAEFCITKLATILCNYLTLKDVSIHQTKKKAKKNKTVVLGVVYNMHNKVYF